MRVPNEYPVLYLNSPRAMAKVCAVTMMFAAVILAASSAALGQAVCLPQPRLLTTMPMGGQVGSQVDVVISGQHLDDVENLIFSHPGITAQPKLDKNGKPLANTFQVAIAKDCPLGIHEARVVSRLGVSSSRVFTIGQLPEVQQTQPSLSVEKAMAIPINSVCNASLTARAVSHFSFQGKKGQRLIADCAAKGVDSKTNPVLIIADERGRDMLVERRGGALDFTVPEDGAYMIKVHDLTFNGGPHHFFRLALQEVKPGSPITRLPSTRSVSSFSWPPARLNGLKSISESEPNNKHAQAQLISLPCDLQGAFYPAADVDTFEFAAKKGEVWWVEAASERLGRPTDPSIIVQRVDKTGGGEKLVDVAEYSDIASPVKRSSNGYSYDGPPYNAGSTDILGKLEIKQDGVYRLQITDLFGGTRSDARNKYRLIIRQAAPDFAVVAWALHMGLRNGDRNALSKPLALRGGSTMALEVVAFRRDGFNQEIELAMENLPAGVTASGLKIAAGKSRGVLLLTCEQNAPRGLAFAKLSAKAKIGDAEVTRPIPLASMAWPVANAWSEIPAPRLVASAPVSVGGSEYAAVTIAAKDKKLWEANAGQTLKIPLQHIRRGEFSGSVLALKTLGAGFEGHPSFEVSLNSDESQAVIDLAKLKTPPGEYVIAFYGSAVEKYRYNPKALLAAEVALRIAQDEAAKIAAETAQAATQAKTASPDEKKKAEQESASLATKKKAVDAAVAAADKRVKALQRLAAPKDIVDIVVSQPITIRVLPAVKK